MTSEGTDDLYRQQLVAAQLELRSLIRSLVPGHSGDVEDIAQNTTLALLRHEADYDPARPFRTWAFSFARLQVMAYWRDRGRSRVVFDDELVTKIGEHLAAKEPGTGPEDVAETLRKLAACEKRLGPDHRELLRKRYHENRPVQDLARERRASPHAVTVELAYIRKRLGDCIRSLCRLDGSEPALTPGEQAIAPYIDRDGGLEETEEKELLAAIGQPGGLDFWLGQNRLEELLRLEASDSVAEEEDRLARRRPWLRIAAGLLLLAGLAAFGASAVRARLRASQPQPAGTAAAVTASATETAAVQSAATAAEAFSVAETSACALSMVDGGAQGENTVMSASKVTAALAVLTTFGVCVAYGGDLEAADTPVSFIDTRSEPCAADTDGVATWVIDTNPPHGTVFTLGN